MSRRKSITRIQDLLREQSTQTVFFHAFIAEKLGLNTTDHKALNVLVSAGEMTAGQLAQATRLTTGATTGVIDRLEKAGHVSRVFDPNDRRKVFLRVAPDVETKLLPVFKPLMSKTQAMLATYSEEDLQVIADFLENCIKALTDSQTGDAESASAASQTVFHDP